MVGVQDWLRSAKSVTFHLKNIVRVMEVPQEWETWLRDEFHRVAGEDARADVPVQVKGEIAGRKVRL